MLSQVTQISSIYQIPPSVDSLQWCKILPPDVNLTAYTSPLSEAEDRLLPTLIECFAVVFCGYLAGRSNLIGVSHIKGLNDFTTYFSLPPLIFLNLTTINLKYVNWTFIASILLSKIIVFFLVALVTAALSRSRSLAYAGIYGIFATQGNDFGLAYPIVASLYGAKRPLYAGYMYLIAPTSLLFLNPLGFILMEADRAKGALKDGDDKEPTDQTTGGVILRTVGKVSWNILRSPIVFVTLLGVFGNFLFQGSLPDVLFGILQIMSSAFSSCVLFLLGFSVASTSDSKFLKKEGLLIPSMLLITKMLVSPLVTRSSVSLMCSGSPDVEDLADYGFLYGMVPTGPIAMLFAAEYGLRTEMMASTMVVCTALFGPVVFILARMLSLKVRGIDQFADELKSTMIVLGVLTFLACVWIGLSFLMSKKIKRQVYKITGCLMISQMLMSVGILVWAVSESHNWWIQMAEIALISGGQLLSRTWVSVLAATLFCMRKRPACLFVNSMRWPSFIGVGFPLLVVVMILIFTSIGQCEPELNKELPLFIYGTTEAFGSVVVLMLCLTTTTCCLILYFRSPSSRSIEATHHKVDDTPKDIHIKVEEDLLEGASTAVYKLTVPGSSGVLMNTNKLHPASYESSPADSPDTSPWHSAMRRSETSFSQRHLLSSSSSEASSVNSSPVHKLSAPRRTSLLDGGEDTHLHLRHVILLILNCISMAVGLTISTWKLSTNQPNGIYVAMEFLDAVLNVGQGVFVFMVFIKDTKYILNPISKWLGKVRHGFYSLNQSSVTEPIVQQLCHQFRTYHRDNCAKDLPRTIKKLGCIHEQCFNGTEFVDWLIKVGLAEHRLAAENYGQRLFRGGSLLSRNDAVQFHDSVDYLYALE